MSQTARRRCGPGPIVVVALLFVLPAASTAQPPAGPPDGQHEPRASLFISPTGQPFRAGPGEPYPVARWFAQVDRDGDGRIERAEFLADAEAFFHALDTNHDGVIDGFEVSNYEHNVVPEILGAYRAPIGPGDNEPGEGGEHHGHRPGGGQGGGRHRRDSGAAARNDDGGAGETVMGGAEPYELLNLPEPVASADTNLTGHVTLSDFMAAANRHFDLLDTKAQGYLTLAELPKTPIQLAAEGKAGRKHKP